MDKNKPPVKYSEFSKRTAIVFTVILIPFALGMVWRIRNGQYDTLGMFCFFIFYCCEQWHEWFYISRYGGRRPINILLTTAGYTVLTLILFLIIVVFGLDWFNVIFIVLAGAMASYGWWYWVKQKKLPTEIKV